MLQNEDAWPLRVRGVILDHYRSVQSVDDIDHVYAVAGELLVAVKRYPHVAACGERAYFVQCLAPFRHPSHFRSLCPANARNEPRAAATRCTEQLARRLHSLVRQPARWYSTYVVFSIEIEREDDGRWLAEVPALAGVMCYGTDRDEAVARVQALALRVIAERLEHRETPAEFLNVTFQAA